MKSWQTTLAGVGSILMAVGGLLAGKVNYAEAVPLIIAGIGLILAKDHAGG